jgi:integrase
MERVRMSARTPSYRLHKPSGQAVVTLNGVDCYLGRHGTPESRVAYDRVIGEWLQSGRQRATRDSDGLTVGELILAYLDFAGGYKTTTAAGEVQHVPGYYSKDGVPTQEFNSIEQAVRPLRALYEETTVAEFGPIALKAVRQKMIDAGLCRTHINQRVGRIVRLFRWGVENQLVDVAIHQALQAVRGLAQGRTTARESKPVRPVPEARVDAIRPHTARQVWAMIELQRLTGMRPGEVCLMRSCDLDVSGRVWSYRPQSHKTERYGRDRVIYLGPKAQEILRPWLRTELTAYLFSPREVVEAKSVERRQNRRTPITPSQRARTRKKKPRRAPGDRYDTRSYYHAIQAACDHTWPHPNLASVPRRNRTQEQKAELRTWRREHRWHPHQLRHNAATNLRREFGLEVARVVLGHSSPAVTSIYAEADFEKARSVMEQVG